MLQRLSARRVVGQSALAIFAIVAVALVCVRLSADEPSQTLAALIYLVIVVFLSLNGSFVAAALVSIIAVVFLQDLATLPLFSMSLDEPLDGVALGAFLTTALVITRLVSKMRLSLERLRVSLDDLRRAEEATRQQAALLDLTHDTVLVRDRQDRITFWNRGAQELYGWSAAEALGQPTHRLLRTEFPAPLASVEAELHRTGRWEGELTQSRRDDSRIVVASRWSLRRDAEARPVATLETNNDITARKQAEDALSQAQTELARVARVTTLGQLAASIAHEVNQPLTGISARASAAARWLAKDPPDIEKVRNMLRDIIGASDRAAEVLTSVRAMFNKDSKERVAIDINKVIRLVLELVRVELQKNAVELQTALGDLPTVECDPVQLQQVLLNLIMNAIEAMHDVQPRVLRIESKLVSSQNVRLRVQDSGPGVNPIQLDRVFRPLVTTKDRGMGMGLSLCRSIIESHRGRIRAQNLYNGSAIVGCRFSFTLPVDTARSDSASPTNSALVS